MSDISFELYRIFNTVAKCKNFSRAADELYVSQSAVSQSIKQLENILGGALFNRTTRGVTLTPEGEVLFSHINNACSIIENAEKKFKDMLQLSTGIIKIGASDTVCNLFLLDVINNFNMKYPEINIKVTNRTSHESIELLRTGEVDIAFINLPIENDAGLLIKPVKEINDCFVVGAKFSYLSERKISLKELEKYPVLMLEKLSNSRQFLDRFFHENGININPAIELGSLDLVNSFAQIGLGVAATIEQTIKEKLENKQLNKLQIAEHISPRFIGLATINGVKLSFAAQAFIDAVNIM